MEPQSTPTSASNFADLHTLGARRRAWNLIRLQTTNRAGEDDIRPHDLIELNGSEKAREGTACRSGTSAEEEHDNDAVRTFVGDRVR